MTICAAVVAEGDAAPAGRPVVKIGIILPLSGEMAVYGEPLRDAALLRVAELEKESTKLEYKMFFEDSAGEMRGSLLAANRLVSLDKVDFLTNFWGDSSMVSMPVAQRAGIPHMTISTFNPKVLGHSPLNSAITTSAEREAVLVVDTCRKLHYKRVAMLHWHSFDGDYAAQAVRDELKKAGMELVADISYNSGEREFLTYLTEIKESKPDVFFDFSVAPEMFIVEKRFKELGLKCDVTTIDGCYDGHEDYEYIQGRWYVSCAAPTAGFSAKYQDKYHRAPEYATGFMYDGLSLIVRAFEETSAKGEKPAPKEAALWLRKTRNIQGVLGELKCDGRGFIDTKPRLMRIADKKPVETTVEEIKTLKGIK